MPPTLFMICFSNFTAVGAVRQLGRLPELVFHYEDNFNSLCHGANEAD